MSAADVTLR